MRLVKQTKTEVLLELENNALVLITPEVYKSGNEQNILLNSVPYSLPFDLFLKYNAENIMLRLYQNGIHTLRDILNNRKLVKRILTDNNSVEELIDSIKGESK